MGRGAKLARLLVVLAALVAGCDTASTKNSTGNKTHHVAFVPPSFTSPFHVAMAEGARAEAQKLGWTIDIQAPASENDFVGQVTQVQQLIEKGAEAISVNPMQTEAMIVGVK